VGAVAENPKNYLFATFSAIAKGVDLDEHVTARCA